MFSIAAFKCLIGPYQFPYNRHKGLPGSVVLGDFLYWRHKSYFESNNPNKDSTNKY